MFIADVVNIILMKTYFTLNSAYDGLCLSGVAVKPEGAPVAVLQIAHGMCGCKERYLDFMEYMSAHGVACVACDHRGHGASIKSLDDLGYMYKGGYKALVEDMKLVSDWALTEFPDTPLVLLGHSMGSMAARIYTKKYDHEISGLVLCGSPGCNSMARVAMLLTWFLARFNDGRMRPIYLQKAVSRRFNRKFASDGPDAWVCSNPVMRREMRSNPLTNFRFTANGLHNLLGMMVDTYSHNGWVVSNPELQVTFLSGEDDPCMNGERSLHDAAVMMYGLGYHNVTSAIFTNMRHEILNETEKQIVWDDILDFIMKIPSK